ncbi:MAG TPA: enoyl-CoA hydratase, partial [Paenibacillaceae bacterium]|nr:enoyl-CoA hydratase [Paenibacillaceae bacterium]
MNQYSLVEVSVENQVAIVTLNRPPFNPLNKELFSKVYLLMEELEQNQEVRVIIITGSGEK